MKSSRLIRIVTPCILKNTVQLKTMLDRMADGVNCQHFTGKYGCAVSTAGGAAANETAAYMNSALLMLGATTVSSVGVVVGQVPTAIVPAEKKAKELGKKLVDAIKTKWKYPAQVPLQAQRREHMKQLVLANKDVWTHEYEHWENRGWL